MTSGGNKNKDLMKLDLYELLGVPEDGTQKQVYSEIALKERAVLSVIFS